MSSNSSPRSAASEAGDEVIAYVDTSVLLRIVLGEPRAFDWGRIDRAIASELIRAEALRVVDRARVAHRLDDRVVADRRAAILASIEGLELVPLDATVLDRAGDPFPTSLNTLDALHLATALALREQVADLVLATHDEALALAARSMGMPVVGVAADT